MRVTFNNAMQCIALFDEVHGTGNPADFYNPDAFVNVFKRINPDILCLAEVPFETDTGQSYFIDALSKQLGLSFSHSVIGDQSWLNEGKWYGLSVLSRWKIQNYRVVTFSNPQLTTRWHNGKTYALHDKHAQLCDIITPLGSVEIINLHGFPFHKFKRRIQEFPTVLSEIEQLLTGSDRPLIVCGDFNNKANPIEELFPNSIGPTSLRNTVRFSMNDYFPEEINGQIDHILCDRRFLLEKTSVEKGLSDHPILTVDLERPKMLWPHLL